MYIYILYKKSLEVKKGYFGQHFKIKSINTMQTQKKNCKFKHLFHQKYDNINIY